MSSYNYPVFGLVFGRGGRPSVGAASSGMTIAQRSSDNSVEREKFTETGTASGYLAWEYTRKISGEHVSVSTVRTPGSLGPTQSDSERKTFFLPSDRGQSDSFANWQIFNADGDAVGADDGTTDTDTSPTATFDSE